MECLNVYNLRGFLQLAMEVSSFANVKPSHSLVVLHGSILGFDSSLC